MKDTTIAVDIAKDVFEIAISKEAGRVDEVHRVSRAKFLRVFANRESARVVMEACGSAHHWAREIKRLGHRVVLLPPHTVRPYVQRSKTDRADVKGILEASRNRGIKPVPVKSVSQHSITALHRFRSTWVASKTARINMVRGLLRELGIFIPVGARKVVPRVLELVEDADSPLPNAVRESFYQACMEIREYEKRISQMDWQLELLVDKYRCARDCVPFPESGFSPQPHLSLSSETCSDSALAGSSPTFSGSRHENTHRETSEGSVASASRASYLRLRLMARAQWHAGKVNPPDRLRRGPSKWRPNAV